MKENVVKTDDEKLIEKIVACCVYLGIFKSDDNKNQIKSDIIALKLLKDVVFVETLYNRVFRLAKERNVLQTDDIKNLLIELERIRIELEDVESCAV